MLLSSPEAYTFVTHWDRFTKTRRIKKIMQSAAKFKRIKLTATDVMKPMIALLFVNIIVLTVWTILDPLISETDITRSDIFHRTIESSSFCDSKDAWIYTLALWIISLVSLAFSFIQACQARKISTEYSESYYIFISTVSCVDAFHLGTSWNGLMHLFTRICRGLFSTDGYLPSQSRYLRPMTFKQFTGFVFVLILLHAIRFCY